METQWIGVCRSDKLKKMKWKVGQKKLSSIQPWEIKTSSPENRVGGRENTVRRSNMFKQRARRRRQRVKQRQYMGR